MNKTFVFLFFICLQIPAFLLSQTETVKIQDIQLHGNKRTQDYIIFREIQFKKGDSLSAAELNEKIIKSEQNIQNTSLFNFVNIQTDTIVENIYTIRVNVTERWYIWPFAMVKTAENNFNTWWIDKNYNHLTLMLLLADLNFRGSREQLILKANFGYDQSFGITYSIPYINKRQTLGTMFDASWSKYHEVNIGIVDLKNTFYRLSSSPLAEIMNGGISFIYRPTYRASGQFSVSYNQFNFNDSIFAKNPFYAPLNKTQILNFYSKIKIDFRDNKSYPLNGFYADLIFTQTGLNFLPAEKFYKTSVQSNMRFYKAFNQRIHYACGINALSSFRDAKAEFLGTEIGGNNNDIRGYEYYNIPVKNFVILKNNIGFTLVKKRTKRLPLIKSDNIGLFHYAIYLNAFFDAAIFSEDNRRNVFIQMTKPQNDRIYSAGIGLDFVTYYDMVFRFEMSHNFLFNQWGFFVNLKASI